MGETSKLLWVAFAAVVFFGVMVRSVVHAPETQAKLDRAQAIDRFAAAAAQLKITDTRREQLRTELAQAFTDLDRDMCDDTLRESAASIAVTYYETLLEQPVVNAGLVVNRLGVCEPGDGTRVPLSLQPMNATGLRLPWDCMPQSWKTPQDLALQARLELSLRSGVLASKKLTGTLGAMTTPSFDSSYTARCRVLRRLSSGTGGYEVLPLIGVQ